MKKKFDVLYVKVFGKHCLTNYLVIKTLYCNLSIVKHEVGVTCSNVWGEVHELLVTYLNPITESHVSYQ